MDWLTSFKKAIDYMETHMLSDIGAKDVADAVHISPSYFQKSFKIVTGYSIGEYLRNRRLYLAGMDVLNAVPADNSPLQKNPKALADKTVLDLAYKYGYDTPESFTKAFSRFHGMSPTQLKSQPTKIKVFLPLIVEISIRGGNKMEFQLSMPMNIEWYSGGDTNSDDYVKKKCFRHPTPRRRRLGIGWMRYSLRPVSP